MDSNELKELFEETARAHHEALLATDGADPEWASWYAEQLLEPLNAHLHTQLTRSELVHFLTGVARDHEARAPEMPWADYYAQAAHKRFGNGTAQERLALYETPFCPFCVRVRRVIAELGIEVESRDTLANPEFRRELLEARGRGTVPVLRRMLPSGESRWMPESADIIHYLRDRFA